MTVMSAVISTSIILTPSNLLAEDENIKEAETTEGSELTEEEQRIQDLIDEGSKLGESKGKSIGEVKGKKDALEKLPFDWERRYREFGNIQDIYDFGRGGEYLKGFEEGYKRAFEKGYGDGYMEVIIKDVTVELVYASETAQKDAISDFYKGEIMDYKRHMLSKEDAIIRFKLTDESDEFKEFFYVEYMVEYEKTYEEKYRQLRTDNFGIEREGYRDGEKIGSKMGEYEGKIDFTTPKATNDWKFSLRRFEEQKSISDRYFLDREAEEYKESFITGFKEAYRLAYNKSYQDLNMDISENNINYTKIAGKAEKLKFKPSDGVGNLGGSLSIKEATFYQETHLGISMDRDSFDYKNLKYKPVNHVYNVAVENRGQAIELDKPMTLNLEYYGSERAGIYQLINGKWKYIYTRVSKDSLEAQIPAGIFKGGKYAIFIDEDYIPVKDIRRHWAKDELYIFLRRGYIKGDKHNNYYPNDAMFRGEFLDLLGKVMGWDYENMYDNSGRFKDKSEFYGYKDAINYAANMGYVSGGTDGKFRPYDPITYNQVEWILKKVLYDSEFNWNSYEEQIKYNKYTNTESAKGKNLPIKRGEVVYMLHKIQQKNLI